MLNQTESKILEFLSARLLTTKGEIISHCSSDGTAASLEKLKESGMVKKVESLGTCYVITPKGIKEVKGTKA